MLLKHGETILTRRIPLCIPRSDGISVENRLLGGEIHVQTIGEAVRFVDMEVIVSAAVRIQMDSLAITKDPVRVEMDGAYYLGPIRRAVEWQTFRQGPYSSRLYMGELTLIVQEEGIA